MMFTRDIASSVQLIGKQLMKALRIRKNTLVTACSIILGLVLLVAGTGKALGHTEFTQALEGSFMTPAMIHAIASYLPWLEISLGVLLLIGLISAFIVNNSWALASDVQTPIKCDYCFGIWERILGSPSPLQALVIDLMLLCLALVVLTQGRLLTRPLWLRAKPSNYVCR